MTDLRALADHETPELVRLRRDFHRHPELSFAEERTSRVVRANLESLGLSVTQPEGMHGMWADLVVPGAPRTLAFRADMDALAMDEVASPSKGDFVSQTPGVAHCCGHDTHMAMLLTAARLLAEKRVEPKHNIRFLFQHAEEKAPGGAIELIRAGCLDGVDEVYGIHVIPPVPSGTFVVVPGPFMAAADELTIEVLGKGGHAAMPHLSKDPIVAAASIVTALQQVVARQTSPLAAMVVSICSIQGGSGTSNVIPDQVTLLGTVRTLDQQLWRNAEAQIRSSVEHAARAVGCDARLDYRRGYPVLVNNADATETARDAVLRAFGADALAPIQQPIMGGEDFARYAELRPSCYVFLGVGSPEKGITSPNHATDFDVDEAALHRGTAWFLELATHA